MKPVAMSRHAVLLSVLVLVLAPHTFSKPSSQDQYEQQANPAGETDKRQPVLHRVQLTSTNLHRFGLLPLQKNQESPKVPDLQVGCADGSVKVPKTEVQVVNKKRHRRSTEENTRKKRDHYHWFPAIPYPIASPYVGSSIASPPLQYGVEAPTLHNPQAYSYHGSFPFHNCHTHRAFPHQHQSVQIVLPLFGNAGVPIFFPPKPIFFNPGFTSNYTPRPEQGPATAIPDSAENMTLDSRFGGPNDVDEHPSWGFVESNEEMGGGVQQPTTYRPLQSRPPSRPASTSPPLFHRPSGGESGEGNDPSLNDPNELQSITTTRRTIQRPPTQRPTQRPPQTTTTAPGRQVDRCVWAITTCCSPSNTNIRYGCFENLGCEGAFWDKNPCSRDIILDALKTVQNFYAQS